VLTDDKKRAAHRALQDRILNGKGRASPEQRARAFSNAGLPEPLDGLLGKVATRPTQVTGACIGLVLGGVLTGAAGWHWIFRQRARPGRRSGRNRSCGFS